MCVCVCVCEWEIERESMCVHVYDWVSECVYMCAHVFVCLCVWKANKDQQYNALSYLLVFDDSTACWQWCCFYLYRDNYDKEVKAKMETTGPSRYRQPKDRPKKPEKQVYVPPCLKKGNFREGEFSLTFSQRIAHCGTAGNFSLPATSATGGWWALHHSWMRRTPVCSTNMKNSTAGLLIVKWIQLLLVFSWGFQPPQRVINLDPAF